MKLRLSHFSIFWFAILFVQVITAQTKDELNILFLKAAENDQVDSVKFWLRKGADVNYINTTGHSSLNYAANNNNIKLCEYLINEGANVDGPENSVPPVFSAAIGGNLRICHLLYLNGANINTYVDSGIKTNSDYVKEFGYLRIAEYLENPEKYSENPTCFEYYKLSKNALTRNDTLTALKYADLAFQTGKIELLQTSNQFGNFINLVATIYHTLGRYEKAEPLFIDALQLKEKYIGQYNSSYVDLLTVAAYNYLNQNKYTEAELHFKKAESICQLIYGENRPEYISALTNLAYCYVDQEKYDKAEPLFQRVEKFLSSKEETIDSEYVSILNILGKIKYLKGNFEGAEQIFKQVLFIQKDLTGIYHSNYLIYSNNLVQIYLEQKKYDDAEGLLLQAKEIQETIGKNYSDYIITLNNLAIIYVQKNQIKNAESIYEHALNIINQHSLENSLSSAILMNALATLYKKIYQWDKAEEFYIKSLQIVKNLEENNTQNYSSMLNNFALFYFEKGQYDKAELLYIESLEIFKEKFSIYHPMYINCLHNLSLLYDKMKLYKKAFVTCGKALGYTNIAIGNDNIDYLRYNNSMASICMNLFYFDLTDSILNSSLQICHKIGLEAHSPMFQNTIELLATLYSNQKKFEKAEPLLLQLLNDKINDVGANSLELADVYKKLGTLYSNQGKFELAKSFYKKAIEIKKEIVGETHPDFIALLNSYGMSCHEFGDYDQAKKCYLDASTKLTNQIKYSFSYLSSMDREQFWEENKSIFNVYNIFVNDSYLRNQDITAFEYNNELFIKGLLLNTTCEFRSMILNSKDSTIIDNWNTLKMINNQLFSYNIKNEEFLKLASMADSIDEILIRKSQSYQKIQTEQKIKWQDIQNTLKDEDAAVEFISLNYYRPLHWTDSTLYCALVLRKGMEYPVRIPLCEQKQLDSLFLGGSAAPNLLYASRGVTAEYKNQIPNGKKLYQLIWRPLEKELKDVKTVYYSPSGSLHQISFAALPIDTVTYLCDRYNLVQLSSTRQLATSAWQTKPGKISSTVLFGGIKYDLEDREIAELQRSLPKNEMNTYRGFTPDSIRSSTTYDSLKWTLDEVESISATLQAYQIKTSLYSGIQGNEETFKSLSNQNTSVLHIATHGFFFPDIQQKPERGDGLMPLGDQRFRYAPNPLQRSGLILAGGNRTWKGEEPVSGMEDGILTAQEISEMNLLNTDLVVLSACETGLGDIKGGEGVFGLQRAFKLAGVKSIIMSLWKVHDKATSEMMQIFYSKWLGGIDKREAFRLAQQELKNNYKLPYYWAGFVMVD